MILDSDRLVRAVASGRRRGEHPTYRRVEFRWVDLRRGRHLQVVSYDDRQAFTRNVEPASSAATIGEFLDEPYGNWHVETVDSTLQLRATKKGDAQVHRSGTEGRAPDRDHDRHKARRIDPSDGFLRAVGISDANGAIKPTMTSKYHQVEEFLRALEPVLPVAEQAAGDAPLRVVDLGCGNAYLSFAGYRWLTSARGRDVRLVGVDVKAQARRRNAALAADQGWDRDIQFVEGTIDGVQLDEPPHVALALHACDTATDDALARAVRWRTPVILAAPCCHHDLQDQLRRAGSVPEPYGLVARHGILRERWADVLTDTFRATILRLLGYRVEVIEFVDSVHTPRNTLLRAVRTGAEPDPALVGDYLRLVREWAVRPALADRLSDRLDIVSRSIEDRGE